MITEKDIVVSSLDERFRLILKPNGKKITAIVQEFCPDKKSKHDGLKILWGNVAQFEIQVL